jgi:hypothetical protein
MMAGLLSDVLPFLYSQGDRAKRHISGLLSDPIGTVQQTGAGLLDAHRDQQKRMGRAFGDKSAPFKVTDEAAMMEAAQAMLNGPLGMAPAGITAWHGSPHIFDKFDSSKIGTGEGAQAYGHGLYLAEAPEVAKQYAGALSAARATKPVGNVDLTQAYQNMPTDVPDTLLAARRDFRALKEMGELSPADRRDFLEAVKGNITAAQGGALYKVDLPDDQIAKMLDWDKPLSQQPAAVRKHFEPMVAPIRAEMAKPADPRWGALAAPSKFDPTGQELLGLLRNRNADMTAQSFLGNGLGPQVSQTLRAQGIPGIRYLDGGSRGAGAGSSNFVVFPGQENMLRILERNGQALP